MVTLGECKEFMTQYLECLKSNSSTSSECRHLNRDYLNCRMQKCVFFVHVQMNITLRIETVGSWKKTNGRI